MGASLDPSAITRLLTIEPTHAHRAGDAQPSHSGVPLRYAVGLWAVDSSLQGNTSPESHILALVDRLRANRAALHDLRRQGCRLDILIGFSLDHDAGGFVLSTECLKQLSDLGVDLDVDIYSV